MTVGTAEKPAGITLYDEVTGDPYCVKMQNGALVSIAGECGDSSQQSVFTSQGESNPSEDSSSPVITIIGNNPAEISIGSSYVDLGATVTDTNADGSVNDNLGLHYNVNGFDVLDISLDTSTTTIHTIIYSSVDGAGNWGYATRTVEVLSQTVSVEPVPEPVIEPIPETTITSEPIIESEEITTTP